MGLTLQKRIESIITVKEDVRKSVTRDALTSPFNFAGFYLDEFIGLSANDANEDLRVIYLDTDVSVQGDIVDLHDADLGIYAVAAVQECSQTISVYIDLALLKKLGYGTFNPDYCIFNRG